MKNFFPSVLTLLPCSFIPLISFLYFRSEEHRFIKAKSEILKIFKEKLLKHSLVGFDLDALITSKADKYNLRKNKFDKTRLIEKLLVDVFHSRYSEEKIISLVEIVEKYYSDNKIGHDDYQLLPNFYERRFPDVTSTAYGCAAFFYSWIIGYVNPGSNVIIKVLIGVVGSLISAIIGFGYIYFLEPVIENGYRREFIKKQIFSKTPNIYSRIYAMKLETIRTSVI